MTPALLDPPKAVRVPCPKCYGTGKQASAWDMSTGAVVEYGPCATCLKQGWVLENQREDAAA